MFKFKVGDKVKVVVDPTGEFLGRTGVISIMSKRQKGDNPYGVDLEKSSNTVPLGNGSWGAWFDVKELERV